MGRPPSVPHHVPSSRSAPPARRRSAADQRLAIVSPTNHSPPDPARRPAPARRHHDRVAALDTDQGTAARPPPREPSRLRDVRRGAGSSVSNRTARRKPGPRRRTAPRELRHHAPRRRKRPQAPAAGSTARSIAASPSTSASSRSHPAAAGQRAGHLVREPAHRRTRSEPCRHSRERQVRPGQQREVDQRADAGLAGAGRLAADGSPFSRTRKPRNRH